MFFRKTPPKCHVPEATVSQLKDSYFQNCLEKLQQRRQMYLCLKKERTDVVAPYEIVFKGAYTISVWRFAELEQAQAKFNLISSIVNVLFYPSNPYRGQLLTFFQELVLVMLERPDWREVHIAARNDYHVYIKRAALTAAQLNAQHPPDLMTPLHVAIHHGHRLTVIALLGRNPDVSLLDAEGSSILHYAAHSANVPILQKILQVAGVRNLLTRNSKHWDPVEMVCFKNLKDNLKAFLKWGLTVRKLTMLSEPQKPYEPSQLAWLATLDDTFPVCFTEDDFKHLDFGYTQWGGCPLHWAKHPDLIEKMVAAGFNIDTTNIKGETALALAVKLGHNQCALALLYNGADANVATAAGDTPLHLAVHKENVYLVKVLIIFNAQVNAPSATGLTARHLAATAGNSIDNQRILSLLIKIGAGPCEETNDKKCDKGCHKEATNTEVPTPFNYNRSHQTVAQEILNGVSTSKESGLGQEVMMACFDGGGIRGLITLQMMLELSKYLAHPLHRYFDWFAGTSTGALIACALSIGRSLTHIRKVYFTLKDKVLVGRKPYNETLLEELLQAECGLETNVKDLLKVHGKNVLLMATRVDRQPLDLQIFRSYPVADEAPEGKTELWKALRASTAAPLFFKCFPPFIDGGMIANNPTTDALVEYFRRQAELQEQNAQTGQLKLVLSFGTGYERERKPNYNKSAVYDQIQLVRNPLRVLRSPTSALLFNKMIGELRSIVTTSNDHIVWRSDSWCSSLGVLYNRLNVPLTKALQLDEVRDEEIIRALWDVKVWAITNEGQLRRLAAVMDALKGEKKEEGADGQ